MNIYVLLKRTFDTEEHIEIKNGLVIEEGAEFIINPYDEYAIEEAITLREKHGGTVTVVTAGTESCEKELRTSLAMGADRAILINLEDVQEADHHTISELVAAYLSKQDVDIILGGNVSVDDGAGQVASHVAEKLGINQVTAITGLKLAGNNVQIERDVEGNVEKIETSLPILMTCQQGLNEPRYPSLPGIMKAKKKPLERIELKDLDIGESQWKPKTETVERFLPPPKEEGKDIEGEAEQQAKELARVLKKEIKVVGRGEDS
ncbi:electron transfer flavoprotein subunit beta/FixA family protein [Alteribacillus iranensis]|uniref:Electron transfer flavoprotein subunit beta n=1 Tax=Alteribacillus iranensis TaxID=930128 RepID=A0A1I2CN69_9BACI|nr:electron transfer flavoprotein subunit beta/FixA family protein [Alteribacillus iranensis]SFE69170.1 electron transfer flavoprotein beta subunit [Alteribacillus iranensis]